MLIRSDIWIRLKHISSTLSTSQGPFLTNWRWAPSSVWSPHFDVHVTFTFSFWGLFLFCCMRVFFTFSFWGQILLFLDLGLFIHFPFFLGVSRETFQLFWFSSFGSKYQCSNWISQLKCLFLFSRVDKKFQVSSLLRNAFSSSVKLQASKICISTCIQILLHVTKWAKIKDNR